MPAPKATLRAYLRQMSERNGDEPRNRLPFWVRWSAIAIFCALWGLLGGLGALAVAQGSFRGAAGLQGPSGASGSQGPRGPQGSTNEPAVPHEADIINGLVAQVERLSASSV